jgi:hypothetical protein
VNLYSINIKGLPDLKVYFHNRFSSLTKIRIAKENKVVRLNFYTVKILLSKK